MSAPKIKLGTDVRAAIEKIQGENEALKQDLARESRQSRLTQVMNSNQGGEVQRLQMEADMYLRKIEGERRKIEQLDYKIAMAQRTIIEQRQKMGGINASKENHDMISKQIRILENRLDKALQKFNESLAMNKQLREQIDNLRKERVVFDGIYKKLEKDLHEKKKEMAAIIEDSKVAYQRSDRAMGEMVALKQQVDKEKAEFEREWRDLGKLMEQDRQLREQLRRQSREEHLAGGARRSGGGDPHDKVVSYEETFAKIREATGVETIKDLVDTFQDIEQKNFSLFNSINELNSDIEASELAIAETKLEIEKYKGQGVSTDTQRKKVLRDLEERLARTEAKADEYDLKHQNATKTINQLKTGIHSIFSRLGCASTSVEEMLGNQGVTESNMMQYLEIIEQRTTEILQMYAASQQSTKDDLLANSALQSGIVQPAASRLSVQPPAWDDFSSGDESDQEDDERPLTREELQRKTLRGLGMKDKNQHHARATKVVKAGGK
ncbi:hypothetical protein AURANDRAFT_19380 [Aureococcus anophagefferens]|uniref:ODAD1 central coiled coil region domain-containing protein n=1 Tax=Aureococcus anophagefferens TaxID=44056 RepID=F0XWP0_AURAN|nr:hypothetical protein AURANDRAFT_19380 [Aureococcus anophagefferens]EGB12807.1 hypothetical protein AURANDRAFT_19380 [Aureococcus anophagefferens]|eukprot:XP_009032447.1 hypothetical protein AURANDRAFT_19380 [Aureococcus anophagefferens]